jgi:hypothetical protein
MHSHHPVRRKAHYRRSWLDSSDGIRTREMTIPYFNESFAPHFLTDQQRLVALAELIVLCCLLPITNTSPQKINWVGTQPDPGAGLRTTTQSVDQVGTE